MKSPHPNPLGLSGLQRLSIGLLSGLVLLASFAVASVLLLVLLVVGLGLGGWVWWKLRRFVRQAQATHPGVLEGEYTVIESTPIEATLIESTPIESTLIESTPILEDQHRPRS